MVFPSISIGGGNSTTPSFEALTFNYGVLNDFMKEWILRKEEMKSGVITRDEYFEWKINWPQTCDDCGKYEPKRKWRSANAKLRET